MLLHSRCVSDMGELSLSREGYTNYLGNPEELRVRVGDDVVVKCSASSSEEPSYLWQKRVRNQCPYYAFGNLSFPLSLFALSLSRCDLSSFCHIPLGFVLSILFIFSPLVAQLCFP